MIWAIKLEMSKLFKPPVEGFNVPEKFKRTQKYLVHKINGFMMFSSGIQKKNKSVSLETGQPISGKCSYVIPLRNSTNLGVSRGVTIISAQ